MPQSLRQVGIDSPGEHSRRLLARPLWGETRNDLGDVDVHAVNPTLPFQLRTGRAPDARRRPLFGMPASAARAFSCVRAGTTTVAPASARAPVVSRPTPEYPPVT